MTYNNKHKAQGARVSRQYTCMPNLTQLKTSSSVNTFSHPDYHRRLWILTNIHRHSKLLL